MSNLETNLERTTIEMTEKARFYIQDLLKQMPKALGMRVGVKKAGCAGFKYVFEPVEVDRIDPTDTVFNMETFKIIVDEKSLPMISGLCIDYVQDQWGFKLDFKNPHARGCCSCGNSFNVAE